MMRGATLLTAAALLVVGTGVAASETEPATPTAAPTPTSDYLLTWETVADAGETFSVSVQLTTDIESDAESGTDTTATASSQPSPTATDVGAVSVTVPFRHVVTAAVGQTIQDAAHLTLTLDLGSRQELEFSSIGPLSRNPVSCDIPEATCRVNVPATVVPTPSASPSPTTVPQPEPTPTVTADVPSDAVPSLDSFPSTAETPSAIEESEPVPSPTGSVESPGTPDSGQDPVDSPTTVEPAAQLTVAPRVVSTWGAGAHLSLLVTNTGQVPLRNWQFELPWDRAVVSLWNADSTSGGGTLRASAPTWNPTIHPGEGIEIGVIVADAEEPLDNFTCSATAEAPVVVCSTS